MTFLALPYSLPQTYRKKEGKERENRREWEKKGGRGEG